jgi:hypothetical protein
MWSYRSGVRPKFFGNPFNAICGCTGAAAEPSFFAACFAPYVEIQGRWQSQVV